MTSAQAASKQHLFALWVSIFVPVMLAFGGLAWQYGSIATRVATLETLRNESVAARLADEKAFGDAIRDNAEASRQQAAMNQELRDGVNELRAGIGELRAFIMEGERRK